MADRDSAASFASATAKNSNSRLGQFSPFDLNELQVIALARIDAERHVGERGRLAKRFARWFGLPTVTGLANPRLEVLRQFALRIFRGDGFPPAADLENFLSAGFSALQARALLQRRSPSSAR